MPFSASAFAARMRQGSGTGLGDELIFCCPQHFASLLLVPGVTMATRAQRSLDLNHSLFRHLLPIFSIGPVSQDSNLILDKAICDMRVTQEAGKQGLVAKSLHDKSVSTIETTWITSRLANARFCA